jgi:hypothetical protein
VSFWNAQLIDGMAALRSLSGSRSWQEVLTVQGEFAAATVQRISSVTAESAGLTRDIASGSLRPLQERAHTAARFSRMAA